MKKQAGDKRRKLKNCKWEIREEKNIKHQQEQMKYILEGY
jgi:hypothetical protein